MNTLRNNLRLPSVAPPAPNQPTNNTSSTHTVRSGETLSGIADSHQTTVTELVRLNSISNPNLIRVGQVLRLPTNASNSQSNINQTIRVGSQVRINHNAQSWATGQSIPNWVKNQIHTVAQTRVRNNISEALLQGVKSWIRQSDITPV